MAVTLLIQFSTDSQFFSLPDSQENLQQSVKDPTAPHMHRYTTLWNANVKNEQQSGTNAVINDKQQNHSYIFKVVGFSILN